MDKGGNSDVSSKPNVILIMTDDQGYGDLGCTGNHWLQTPNIDRFHQDSVRFGNFHVSPLCTPTRGAIMTGHRPVRNGAWATTWGRSMLRRDEVTMAVFAGSGYHTGMFGKWHLGDNYPYRPQDRGFQHVVAHKGGGVGGTPDFWGNSYFDDTYFHNSKPIAHEGYCTDIWFDEAMKFIERHSSDPFFRYLATNAPHSPYLVADRYKKLYEGNPDIPQPAFYGMITNIDENFGRLREKLRELRIEDNTILIFMTDNGSSGGCTLNNRQFVDRGYNAGMRGKKGSYYEGGHRVPFFVRWPSGGLNEGRDIGEMAMHIDLLPTFIDLCELNAPDSVSFDGASLAPLICGERNQIPGDRVHFMQYRQNTDPPEKWVNAVMTNRWRLIYGKELYDIKADPGQKRDVAAQHPDVVSKLRDAHEGWWDEIAPRLNEYGPISIGSDEENPIRLDAFDVMGDVAWDQIQVAMALKSAGKWSVDVEEEGEYQFSLRRWPEELDLPIDAIPSLENKKCDAINPVQARLRIFHQEEARDIEEGARAATFSLLLQQTGVTQLEASFIDDAGEAQGAYYVYVRRL